jgi:hypothetical protein
MGPAGKAFSDEQLQLMEDTYEVVLDKQESGSDDQEGDQICRRTECSVCYKEKERRKCYRLKNSTPPEINYPSYNHTC